MNDDGDFERSRCGREPHGREESAHLLENGAPRTRFDTKQLQALRSESERGCALDQNMRSNRYGERERRGARCAEARALPQAEADLLLVSLPLQQLSLLVLAHLLAALLDDTTHDYSPCIATICDAGPCLETRSGRVKDEVSGSGKPLRRARTHR